MAGRPSKEQSPLEVVWEEPPPEVPKTQYGPIVEQLKMKPGEWARIRKTETSGGAYNTRKGITREPYGVGIEARVVPHDDGTFLVYARYVENGRRRSSV